MKSRSAGVNALVLFLANVASAVLTLVLAVYAARILGGAEFGKYSFALAYTALFGVLVPLGLDIVLVRDVARDKALARKYLGNMALIQVVSSVVVFALMAFSVNILGYSGDTVSVVYVFGLYVVLTSFSRLFKAVFQAYERMEYQALIEFASRLAITVAGVTALEGGLGLYALAVVFLLGGLLELVLSYILCTWRFASYSWEIDLGLCARLIRESLPIFIAYALSMVYFKVDIIMLSLMRGDEAVGLYSAPYRLVDGLTIVSTSLLVAMFPLMSRLFKKSKMELANIYSRSLKVLLVIGLPIAVGTTLLASQIILGLFGEEYAPSAFVLQVLIWAELFLFVNNATGNMLKAVNRQKVHMWIIAAGCAFNIGLNLLLIPRFGFLGAAYTTLATEFFVAASGLIYLDILGFKPGVVGGMVLASFACVVMGAVTSSVSSLGLLPSIVISGIVYSGLMLLLGVVTRAELRWLVSRVG
jgi:O-antigen/teichoic acid export membrane protein